MQKLKDDEWLRLFEDLKNLKVQQKISAKQMA